MTGLLFQDDKKSGKTHITLLIYMTRRIQRYITCPDRWSLPGGDRSQRLTEILLHRYTRVSPSQCLGFIARWQKNRENAPHVPDLHDHTNPTVYHLHRSVQSPERSLVSKLTEILLHRDTRVSPSQCLGFIPSWQKIRENASRLTDLHDQTNPTVHHMSRSVESPRRRCVTKVNGDSPTYIGI